MSLGQAIGFENALRNYLAGCSTRRDCTFNGTVDEALRQISDLLESTRTNPLPTRSGRYLNQPLAFNGVATTLYDHEAWSLLDLALSEALHKGTGNQLLFLSDFYLNRNPDGSFSSNLWEAFSAVGCADSRGTTVPEEMAALRQQLVTSAPTFGHLFAYGGLVCRDWPVPMASGTFDLHATGAPEILVIGTTGDPATPYEWAVGLAETLDNGVLLTFEGEGHTAYGRSNACIEDTVDQFLVDGVVPPDGKRC
jgi:hypothetical protein